MIQSLDRGLQILGILGKKRSAGVTELAKELGVDKSTAFRMLDTMMRHNLIQQDENTAKYKLGIGILRLSQQLLNNLNIINISRPFMRALVDFTNESAHLCSLSNDKAYVVDQVISNSIIKVSATIGLEEPIYCSSVGKCILAFMTEEKREKILEKIDLKPYTSKTITSKEMLIAHLEQIRLNGYALDDEELNVGVRCIAAPIFNHMGKVKNSIGISGPATRMDTENISIYSEKVKETARLISQKIGY